MSAPPASERPPGEKVDLARRRAGAFVAEHGDVLSRARVRVLLGEAPVDAVLDALDASHATTGLGSAERAHPLRPGELLRCLAVLDDVRVDDAPLLRGCCLELRGAQRDDGAWVDRNGAGDAERLFTTGMLAGYLAKTRFARESTLERAADHLAAAWDPDLVKGRAWAATAAYAHCFALVRHEAADGILQWCGRELDRGYRTGLYDAVRTGRVLDLCRAHAFPGSQLSAGTIVARLLDEQAEDGGFTPDGDASKRARVDHTLQALALLVHLV